MSSKKQIKFSNKDLSVVDLFCGIGGLSHGFKIEKIKIAGGFDIDSTCQYSYEENNNATFYSKDISKVTGDEISKLFGKSKIRILVGCAPCQPFSSYNFKTKENVGDKWSLLYQFARLVRETNPQIVSMENVAQLINFKKAPVYSDFIEELKSLGYSVKSELVHCPDFGIPQNRKRLVLLASKLGEINLIPKTHTPKNYRTVKDTIGNLPKISDGEFATTDAMHFARKLTPINKKRIRATPYGGSWKDWSMDLRLECHKRETGKSYPSVYGRMKWEEPSPTITTHCIGYGNGRFGHPEQHRAISLREAALLQTFPLDYKFIKDEKNFSSVVVARQLGNAVPVLLGQVIAQSIKEHLNQFSK